MPRRRRAPSLDQKLARLLRQAVRIEREAAACDDEGARRHLLRNAAQHRFNMLDLLENYASNLSVAAHD